MPSPLALEIAALVTPPPPVCKCQSGQHMCLPAPVEYGTVDHLLPRLAAVRAWIDEVQR